MQFQPEVKQALKQLPPAERVVAVALKNIYEKIRNLYSKEKSENDKIRFSTMSKCIQIQDKMASVIQGRKISENQLIKPDQYFVEEEKQQLKNVLQLVAPIKDYWLDAIKNSPLKNQAVDEDWKIITHLRNISQKVSESTLELKFTFQQNSFVKAGSYTRILSLQNGSPVNYKGDRLQFLTQPTNKGLINFLFQDTTQDESLYAKFEIITFFINDFIPYSLRFFLGQVIVDEDEQDDEQDEDQQEQVGEEGESEQSGQKGRKKN